MATQIDPRFLPPSLRALAKTPAPRKKGKKKATEIPDWRWKAEGLPVPEREYRFHPVRKWKSDFAWVELKVVLECEGGAWSGGRHTQGSGFIEDMHKYNELAAAGFRLVRCTPQMVETGEIFEVLRRVLG